MKKSKHIRPIAYTLLAFFMFSATFSIYFNPSEGVINIHKLIIAKKGASSTTTDFQIPFEEEEKEAEDGSDDEKNNELKNPFLQAFFFDINLTATNFDSQYIRFFNSQKKHIKSLNLPLFISYKSFLI